MKTPSQSKKTWWFWQQRGRIKRAENNSNRVSKKHISLYFCQSSSKYELNSYTWFKRRVYTISNTWGPKLSNNKHDLDLNTKIPKYMANASFYRPKFITIDLLTNWWMDGHILTWWQFLSSCLPKTSLLTS